MLVISRKIREVVKIGDSITVAVARVQGSRVTIAVEAPKELKVLRGEVKGKAA